MAFAIFYQKDELIDYIEYTEKEINCEFCPKNHICCKMFDVPLTPHECTKYHLNMEAWGRGMAVLAKKETGDCFYLDKGKCTIWYDRPIACREYSCEGDERVYISA